MDEKIFHKVTAYIEKHRMIASGDTIVTGVSGGADSVCLFSILHELAETMMLRLIVVHVNHGIRGADADADASYVESLCRTWGVPFVLVREDVRAYARNGHLSEEEAGRKVRYRAFEEALKKYVQETVPAGTAEGSFRKGKIAVAHNANDRAETMLFHLFRGAGLTGAAAMKPVRGNVIRPVLCLERKEIEEYLRQRQLSFCIDRTNMEDTYTRNRIRNHIFPYVEKEVCHGAVGHMCEAADRLAEAEGYIRKQAELAYRRCILEETAGGDGGMGRPGSFGRPEVRLDAGRLMEEEAFIRRQVLLLGLEKAAGGRRDIASVHVLQTEKLLDKRGSKQISLPHGLTARREPWKGNTQLVLCRAEEQVPQEPVQIAIPGTAEVPGLGKVEFSLLETEKLPPENELAGFFWGKSQHIPQKTYTKWFDYDRITKSLVFRVREKGDYLTINESLSRKKLKDYMINEKIPKERRGKIYVLAEESHVIWVPEYRISEYYKITENTKRILQVQIGGGT